MAEKRKEFDNAQAQAAKDYYEQQLKDVRATLKAGLNEQIADVERQHEESMKKLAAIPLPAHNTKEYEEALFERVELEIRLEREKNKKIEDLQKSDIETRTKEIEKAVQEQYNDDFEKYADNERVVI